MSKIYNNLILNAKEAQKLSYSPYSNVTVGAALLTKSNKIYTGANIENSSYGATVCAERVAIFNAILNNEKDFKALAITSNLEDFTFPCGLCLQVISEFSKDMIIIITNKNGKSIEKKINELLPYTFSL